MTLEEALRTATCVDCSEIRRGALAPNVYKQAEASAVLAAEVKRLQDEALQTGDRLDLAERVVAACVIVNQIRPMPLAIMEPVHRWQEYRAAQAAKEEK